MKHHGEKTVTLAKIVTLLDTAFAAYAHRSYVVYNCDGFDLFGFDALI